MLKTMAIPTEPFQVLYRVISSVPVPMMHDQNSLITKTATPAFSFNPVPHHQLPVSVLADNPIGSIDAEAMVFILPRTMAPNRTEEVLAF